MPKRNSKKSSTKAKTQASKRKYWSIALVAILIGLGVLTYIRWNSWFGNKPEVAYETDSIIDRITLTPGSKFDQERTISWRCGEELKSSWLEYGLAEGDTSIIERVWLPAKGQDIASRSGHGCFYQAKIYGLKPGKTYRYRVHTGDISSERYTFSMPDIEQESSFLYIGDVQDPKGDESRSMFAKLQELPIRIDFLAAAGDQIEGPANQYWESWYQAFGAWAPRIPLICSTGNHEYLKKGPLRELDPRWVAQHGYPDNGPEGFEGRSYFIDFPLYRYIVMDSNGIRGPIDIMRHRMWLSETLRGSAQPWQIVMFHHGIYSVREGRSNPIMRYGFRSILEDEGADLVLQGHDHAYSRINNRNDEGKHTTPVYIISSSSPKLYRNGFDEIHDRLGSGLQLYQHITINKSKIHYRSYKYSGELYDDIELIQNTGKSISIKDNTKDIPEEFLFNSFGQNSKGRKKAAKYKASVQEYLSRKRQAQ